MSSLTDHNQLPTMKAQRRSSLSGLLGGVALLVALGLMGTFIWQAGVLAPPAPQDVKSDEVVAKPDQITASKASISGRDKNDRPYTINAVSGEQDKTIDTLVLMNTVTGAFERPSGAKLDIASKTGQYDHKSKALELSGDVVFTEGTRFKATMDKAAINTDDQSLVSKSPVKVDMQGAMIEAASLSVTENGTRILFKGGVKAKFITHNTKTGDTP
jgi:lipopolysaccharide export system protein LptC